MKVRKAAYTLPISREMALSYGLVEPTPEEAAQMAIAARKWHNLEVAAWAVFDEMVPALALLTDPVSRAVLDLHRRDVGWTSTPDDVAGQCVECYRLGDAGDHEQWPCVTVRRVAAAWGIEHPEIELWRRPEDQP